MTFRRSRSHVKGHRRGGVCVLWMLLVLRSNCLLRFFRIKTKMCSSILDFSRYKIYYFGGILLAQSVEIKLVIGNGRSIWNYHNFTATCVILVFQRWLKRGPLVNHLKVPAYNAKHFPAFLKIIFYFFFFSNLLSAYSCNPSDFFLTNEMKQSYEEKGYILIKYVCIFKGNAYYSRCYFHVLN